MLVLRHRAAARDATQAQLVGEPPGSPVGSFAAGQPDQAVSAVTGRPPLQRPAGDSAMSGQPGERHAIFDVRAQDLREWGGGW